MQILMSALTVNNTHATECARIQMVHSLVIVLRAPEEMHLLENARKIPFLHEHRWPLVRAFFLSCNTSIFIYGKLAGSHVELSLACCRINLIFTTNKIDT